MSAIYEEIPLATRQQLTALLTLAQFTRKAILDATGGGIPYAGELKKQEILHWVAVYGNPVDILARAYENAKGGA